MKKIIISVTVILILCGCDRKSSSTYSGDDYRISIYTDSKTCVEYLEYLSGYGGGLSVRYNANGTIKLNKECLNEKDN